MTAATLQLDDVHCGYNTRPVLNGVSLSLNKGETTLLAGPNGCGKSTLIKAVVGMLPLTKGKIFFHGSDQKHRSTEARINSGIGYLCQTDNIFPGLSARENLELSGLSLPKAELSDRVSHVLSTFDFLEEVLDRRAGALSGGQRQALAIAMVILHPRKLYLLDEPTAGLSPKAAVDIMERLRTFAKEQEHSSILMVEHRLELLDWIDRAFVLMQGEIKAEAKDTSLFLESKWLAEHYF